MMSVPFICSWEVSSVPIDEEEVEFYKMLEQHHSGVYFNIKVRVKHRPRFTQSQPQIPFRWLTHEKSMLLPSQELYEYGPSYMKTYFADDIILNEVIPSMMSEVITRAKDLAQNCHSVDHFKSPHFRLFNLLLDVVIENERDDDITNMVMRETMEEVEMVPASRTAIESLQEVKLKKDSVMKSCRICLTEFDDSMEVSSMPCKHVYHKQRLIKWLKTSYMCPLCRYPMPTSNR